jgi:hypothetical protein
MNTSQKIKFSNKKPKQLTLQFNNSEHSDDGATTSESESNSNSNPSYQIKTMNEMSKEIVRTSQNRNSTIELKNFKETFNLVKKKFETNMDKDKINQKLMIK